MLVRAGKYNVSKFHRGKSKKSHHQERRNNPINKDTESNLDPDTTLSEDVV